MYGATNVSVHHDYILLHESCCLLEIINVIRSGFTECFVVARKRKRRRPKKRAAGYQPAAAGPSTGENPAEAAGPAAKHRNKRRGGKIP